MTSFFNKLLSLTTQQLLLFPAGIHLFLLL
jgi:hypothetical protein